MADPTNGTNLAAAAHVLGYAAARATQLKEGVAQGGGLRYALPLGPFLPVCCGGLWCFTPDLRPFLAIVPNTLWSGGLIPRCLL